MNYQKLLISSKPFVNVHTIDGYDMHRHAEVEFCYALKGDFEIWEEDKCYKVKEQDIIIIGSMVPHGFWDYVEDSKAITFMVGTSFFGDSFNDFSEGFTGLKIYSLKAKKYEKLKELFSEAAEAPKKTLDLYRIEKSIEYIR